MEMIDVSGYVAEEKMAIAKQYLIPQAMKDSGLKDEMVNLWVFSLKIQIARSSSFSQHTLKIRLLITGFQVTFISRMLKDFIKSAI